MNTMKITFTNGKTFEVRGKYEVFYQPKILVICFSERKVSAL